MNSIMVDLPWTTLIIYLIIIASIGNFLCGIFASMIAIEKHRSGVGFFFVGFLFGMIGLIYAAGMITRPTTEKESGKHENLFIGAGLFCLFLAMLGFASGVVAVGILFSILTLTCALIIFAAVKSKR